MAANIIEGYQPEVGWLIDDPQSVIEIEEEFSWLYYDHKFIRRSINGKIWVVTESQYYSDGLNCATTTYTHWVVTPEGKIAVVEGSSDVIEEIHGSRGWDQQKPIVIEFDEIDREIVKRLLRGKIPQIFPDSPIEQFVQRYGDLMKVSPRWAEKIHPLKSWHKKEEFVRGEFKDQTLVNGVYYIRYFWDTEGKRERNEPFAFSVTKWIVEDSKKRGLLSLERINENRAEKKKEITEAEIPEEIKSLWEYLKIEAEYFWTQEKYVAVGFGGGLSTEAKKWIFGKSEECQEQNLNPSELKIPEWVEQELVKLRGQFEELATRIKELEMDWDKMKSELGLSPDFRVTKEPYLIKEQGNRKFYILQHNYRYAVKIEDGKDDQIFVLNEPPRLIQTKSVEEVEDQFARELLAREHQTQLQSLVS